MFAAGSFRRLRAPVALTVLLASAGSLFLASPVRGQYCASGYGGPYVYSPFIGQPYVSAGPPIAAGWEALGDGIVGNEPAGAMPIDDDGAAEKRLPRTADRADAAVSNFDVRFISHGWVIVWDRLVPLTDLARNGVPYELHGDGSARVRIRQGGRTLFEDVLFAESYEKARTLLEGN